MTIMLVRLLCSLMLCSPWLVIEGVCTILSDSTITSFEVVSVSHVTAVSSSGVHSGKDWSVWVTSRSSASVTSAVVPVAGRTDCFDYIVPPGTPTDDVPVCPLKAATSALVVVASVTSADHSDCMCSSWPESLTSATSVATGTTATALVGDSSMSHTGSEP